MSKLKPTKEVLRILDILAYKWDGHIRELTYPNPNEYMCGFTDSVGDMMLRLADVWDIEEEPKFRMMYEHDTQENYLKKYPVPLKNPERDL